MSEESATPELAPVREGEALDWARLEQWLRASLDETLELTGPMAVQQFPAGSANLTYLVRFGAQELVVRRPPFGELPPGAHDMAREYRVLARLWRAFDPAPRAFAFCDDPAIIGAPFFVMERREGVVIHDAIPAAMTHHPNVARRVSFALVEAMAAFHAVDATQVGLGELGRPQGFVTRQVTGWYERWQRAQLQPLPIVDEVHARLARSQPESASASLVHNDLKLDNCQFDPAHPDRVKSIFDWDMTTLGDPLVDLGTLLGYWPDPEDTVDRAPRAGWSTMGLPRRETIAARYAELTGVPLARVRWYEAFALWKTAVVIQQIYRRWATGESSDPRFADRGARVPELAELARSVLDEADLR